MRTVYLKISGKVQGVFFRVSARDRALELNLTGWVQNRNDFVEAVISGQDSDVEHFIEWANVGPERAKVEQVEISDMPYQSFGEFLIKRGQ